MKIWDYLLPFGAKIYENKVVDFMAYEEFEDTINGSILIDMMKGSIMKEFQNGKVDAGAIAYDVVINVDNEEGVQVKRDALCLIYSVDGKNWIDEYYPYLIVDNQCIWT